MDQRRLAESRTTREWGFQRKGQSKPPAPCLGGAEPEEVKRELPQALLTPFSLLRLEQHILTPLIEQVMVLDPISLPASQLCLRFFLDLSFADISGLGYLNWSARVRIRVMPN